MKKSILCIILVLIVSAFIVSAAILPISNNNVKKQSMFSCSQGQKKCYLNEFQECDGSKFTTLKVCATTEYCSVNKGCASRNLGIVKKSKLDSFYEFRLTECKENEFVCRGRFVKVCKNHIWQQEFCKMDEVCVPNKMCTPRITLTRLQQRDAHIPRTPKVPLLHYG